MTVSEAERAETIDPARLQAVLGTAGAQLEAEDLEGAIETLLTVAVHVRRHPFLANSLGYLYIKTARPEAAIPWFEAALALKPDYPNATAGLGIANQEIGALEMALAAYDKAVLLAPDEPENWYNRASVLSLLDRLSEALDDLTRAIDLNRTYAKAYAKRTEIHERQGNIGGAIIAAQKVADLAPAAVSSWRVLGGLHFKQGNSQEAITSYRRALAIDPDDMESLCNCGDVLRQAERPDEAEPLAARALALDPDFNEALMLAAQIAQGRGDLEEATTYFARIASKGLYCSYPAVKKPARFRATLLFSPLAGNTPYEDLLSDRDFDADVLLVIPGHHYETTLLEGLGDVIVNLVADADLGRDLIDLTEDIVTRAGRPVINPPQKIATTDREQIAHRLQGLTDVIMPATRHADAVALRAEAEGGHLAFPLIVRQAGTHGGEAMERIADTEALLAFLEEVEGQPLYRTDYVDYRSPDGLFRKYRFLFVGKAILPYHLAIGESWKVHHQSTRMSEFAWMRQEEADFLANPESTFGPAAMKALETIRQTIGLDYFGIDCALDPAGRVVVFEVNATMLIHFHNKGFEYKTPYVARIRDAFQALLAERQSENRC